MTSSANIYLNIILLCYALIPDQTRTCTTQLAHHKHKLLNREESHVPHI